MTNRKFSKLLHGHSRAPSIPLSCCCVAKRGLVLGISEAKARERWKKANKASIIKTIMFMSDNKNGGHGKGAEGQMNGASETIIKAN